MKSAVLVLMLLLYFPLPLIGQRLVPPRKYHSDDDDDFQLGEDDEEEPETNSTGIGAIPLVNSFYGVVLQPDHIWARPARIPAARSSTTSTAIRQGSSANARRTTRSKSAAHAVAANVSHRQ